MPSASEYLFETRTDNARGALRDEWNHTLLWRDLDRLIALGLVEPVEWPIPAEADSRERRFFRELETHEIYVYLGRAERVAPEFRRLSEDDTSGLKIGTQSIQ
jgi:hypothetical protein